MIEVEKVLSELTLEEKILLVSGTNFMFSNEIKRLDIPSIRFSDGPHGLRVQEGEGDNGIALSKIATCFPTSATSANSFNKDNLYKIGKAISNEAHHYGVNVVLGPGVNIKRNPRGGRNFEYFSEDPILTAIMASSEIRGLEDNKVGCSVKHFALNNSENYRFLGNSIVDERTMHELYLAPFKKIVKEAKPSTFMCSYNKINNVFASENKLLIDEILRKKWGFSGAILSDWGATHDRVEGIRAGLDLEMPGDTLICREWIKEAIKNKTLDENDLNNCVRNILNLINKLDFETKEEANFKENSELSYEVACDSAVLLKNEDNILPLNKNKKYLIIGDLFNKMRYQGSGSSLINPYKLITPKNAFDSENIDYSYIIGYKENSEKSNSDLLKEVEENIKNYDIIVFFAGLTDLTESESSDRETMSLPQNQLEVLDLLIKERKDVVVVLFGGSPIEMPFKNDVKAILNMYLPGQEGGRATKDILFGKVNPSGRLAETYPISINDVPYNETFSKEEREIYKEGIFVGYRYYSTFNKEVNYPFGYGLSYTKFSYSDLKVIKDNQKVIVKVNVKNDGEVFGGEVVQVYVRKENSSILRPKKELKGFSKVYLSPNETQEVTIEIPLTDLEVYDLSHHDFALEEGEYIFEVSKDVNTPLLETKIYLSGVKIVDILDSDIKLLYECGNFLDLTDRDYEKVLGFNIEKKKNKTPITLESRFSDLNETFFGKILYKAVLSRATKQEKEAQKLSEGQEKDNMIKGAYFLRKILESNSLITMSMSSYKNLPYHMAVGMMHLSNGKLIKAIKAFLNKLK